MQYMSSSGSENDSFVDLVMAWLYRHLDKPITGRSTGKADRHREVGGGGD